MTSSHVIILFVCTCTIFIPLNVHTDVQLVTRPGQVVDSVVDTPPNPAARNDGVTEADGVDGGGDGDGGGVDLGRETAGVQITEKGGDKIMNFKSAMYDVGAYGRIVDDGDGKEFCLFHLFSTGYVTSQNLRFMWDLFYLINLRDIFL